MQELMHQIEYVEKLECYNAQLSNKLVKHCKKQGPISEDLLSPEYKILDNDNNFINDYLHARLMQSTLE